MIDPIAQLEQAIKNLDSRLRDLANREPITTAVDAATVDGFSASATPTANTIPVLDSNGKIPEGARLSRGFAKGITSGPSTSSTSYSDLADMSVTITTFGGDLLVSFSGSFAHNTLSQERQFRITLDGVEQYAWETHQLVASHAQPDVANFLLEGVSAGEHTVKIQWKVGGGTLSGRGVMRTLSVVEV